MGPGAPHTLHYSTHARGNFIFCSSCGCYGAPALYKPCKRVLKAYGRQALDRLYKGMHPSSHIGGKLFSNSKIKLQELFTQLQQPTPH